MAKRSSSQQRTQNTIRIVLIIFSLLIVISMVLSLLPLPQ